MNQEDVGRLKKLAQHVLTSIHHNTPELLEGTGFTEQELFWALSLVSSQIAEEMSTGKTPW